LIRPALSMSVAIFSMAQISEAITESMKALSFSCSLVLSACECRHCAECFQGFGRADHAVTADLLRKKYSDYASIVWKDD